MKRTWIWIALAAPLVLTPPGESVAQDLNLGTEAQQQAGKVLYDNYCSQCHGAAGEGKGYAAPHLRPQPRDFTSGKFKLRTTPSGALPTDDDLRKVIRQGMPYTTMIGWSNLSDQDVDNIIYYLKTFSEDFKDPDYYEAPITIPDPPPYSPESAEQGREVYVQMECRRCHGDQGRGDGPSAPSLVNDAGETIVPADLTKRWTFRGGPTRRDIYRTFSTGLNGTPMPSYADSLTAEQRWLLVNYVYSLGRADEPNYSERIISKSIDDDLDMARGEALFEGAESAYLPLIGQIIEPGREFHPTVNGIEVKAVHNREEIAFLLRWHDMRADVAGENGPDLEASVVDASVSGEEPASEEGELSDPFADAIEPEVEEDAGGDFWGDAAEPEGEEDAGEDFWGDSTEEVESTDDFFSMDEESEEPSATESGYSDAVAIQVPSRLPEGIRLPYFIFGDVENPVDIWFADLAQKKPQRFAGRGSGSLTPGDPSGLEMSAVYEAGVWTVIFKRERRLEDAMAIDEGEWYAVAFSVWDGTSEDRGNKRALTRWYYAYIEPSEKVRPLVPMTKAALATLGLEIILIAFIRRKYKDNSSISRTDT